MSAVRALVCDVPPDPQVGGGGGCEPPPSGAVQRLACRYPRLLPQDDSPKAFVEWLSQHGHGGDWMLTDLFETYVETCHVAARRPVNEQAFCSGLAHMGLIKGQLDLRRNGKRFRPTYYVVPGPEGTEK